MATLHLLGTGAVISDPHRTTTMLALETEGSLLLVDCGGDVVQRLRAAGLDPLAVRGLIVTHEHADHVSGLPLLLERLWLHGLRAPLPIYGIPPAVAQARRLHDAFDTTGWPGYPGATFTTFAPEAGARVLEDACWRVTAAPGRHAVPTSALRIEDRRGGGTMAYSSDTEYAPEVVALARGVDLLVHEATGSSGGHASSGDAARVAREAGAGRLLLVHLPPAAEIDPTLAAARETFAALEKGEEGGSYRF